MRRTIVLAGNSPLLYFVALELNKSTARQVENNVVWLTSEKYLSDLTVNSDWGSTKEKVLLSKKLENIKFVQTEIQSISLADRRVVISRGVIDYDLLIIDQQPVYGYGELSSIKKAVSDILLTVKASHNQNKPSTARIVCKGDSVESLELACRISEYIRSSFPKLVRWVGVDVPIIGNQSSATSFMTDNNLYETGSQKADLSLTLEGANPYLSLKKIRGLKVGAKGLPLLEVSLEAKSWPGVFIIDGSNRSWQNLLHFQKSAAKRVAVNIESLIENRPLLPVQIAEKAIFLSANHAVFVELGDMISNRTRARIISRLEQRLLHRLQD